MFISGPKVLSGVKADVGECCIDEVLAELRCRKVGGMDGILPPSGTGVCLDDDF